MVTASFLLIAPPAIAADLLIHRDLPYAEPQNKQQRLDVYTPAKGENHPMVLWIHGGGWITGDKTDYIEVKSRVFSDRGFILVSINYRFVPTLTIGEMAGDVAKATRWIHDHAKEFGGDPNSIFVMGWSAGAQLAALVCTDDSYLKAEGLSLRDIKGCVPIDGDSYYVALQIDTSEPSRAADYLRQGWGDAESQKAFSSVLHVARNKGIPPFLILHVADHPDPATRGTQMQSEILAEALRESSVPVEVVPAAGKKHLTIFTDLGLPGDKPTRAVFEFLELQMRKSTSVP